MKTATARAIREERIERTAPVRVVKPDRAARELRAFKRRVTAMTVVLALLMAGTVYSRLVLSETKSDINACASELTELESENAYLSYKLESLVSLKNAEEYAVDTLGLVKLDKSRVEYVNLQKENVIEGSQNEAPLGETLREWFDSVIDSLDG